MSEQPKEVAPYYPQGKTAPQPIKISTLTPTQQKQIEVVSQSPLVRSVSFNGLSQEGYEKALYEAGYRGGGSTPTSITIIPAPPKEVAPEPSMPKTAPAPTPIIQTTPPVTPNTYDDAISNEPLSPTAPTYVGGQIKSSTTTNLFAEQPYGNVPTPTEYFVPDTKHTDPTQQILYQRNVGNVPTVLATYEIKTEEITLPEPDIPKIQSFPAVGPTNIIVKRMVEEMGPSSKFSLTESFRDVRNVIVDFVTPDAFKKSESAMANVFKETSPFGKVTSSFLTPSVSAKAVVDVPIGFVKGAESLINPNVKSYVDIITDTGRESYFKDIEGREGEFLGEVLFDVVGSKGLAKAGKAVGLSSKALVAGAALNVGVAEVMSLSNLQIGEKGITVDFKGPLLSSQQVRGFAYGGAIESIFGTAALRMVAESGPFGEKVASSILGRASVEATTNAFTEGVANQGDIQAITRGAVFGGVFSVGFDLAGKYIPVPKYGKVEVELDEPNIMKGLRESKQFTEFYDIDNVPVIKGKGDISGVAYYDPATGTVMMGKSFNQPTLQHELGHATHFELSQTPEGVSYLKSQGLKPFGTSVLSMQDNEVAAWVLAAGKAKAYGQFDDTFITVAESSIYTYGVKDLPSTYVKMKTDVQSLPDMKSLNFSHLELPSTVEWKGLYLDRGDKATLLLGKMSNVPEGFSIKSHGVSGEDIGFVPMTGVESEVTLKVMKELNYDPKQIQIIEESRYLMGKTKNIKSKYLQDYLPEATQTLSKEGVTIVKEFSLENPELVDRFYGSYTQRSQVSTEFEYTIKDAKGFEVSALREPADIDIQLKVDAEQATLFTSNLIGRLKDIGEGPLRISPKKTTLIEAQTPEGKWRHAVDVHAIGDLEEAVPKKAWGFEIQKENILIENIPSQQLSEQGLAKAVSVLGFKEDLTIGPVTHRAKDIPDFLQAQRSLLESTKLGPTTKDIKALDFLVESFGVTELPSTPPNFEYVVSSPSMEKAIATKLISTPTIITSKSFTPSKNITSKSIVSYKSPSKTISAISKSIARSTLPSSTPTFKVIEPKITSLSNVISKESKPITIASLESPSKILYPQTKTVTPSSFSISNITKSTPSTPISTKTTLTSIKSPFTFPSTPNQKSIAIPKTPYKETISTFTYKEPTSPTLTTTSIPTYPSTGSPPENPPYKETPSPPPIVTSPPYKPKNDYPTGFAHFNKRKETKKQKQIEELSFASLSKQKLSYPILSPKKVAGFKSIKIKNPFKNSIRRRKK